MNYTLRVEVLYPYEYLPKDRLLLYLGQSIILLDKLIQIHRIFDKFCKQNDFANFEVNKKIFDRQYALVVQFFENRVLLLNAVNYLWISGLDELGSEDFSSGFFSNFFNYRTGSFS